MYLLVGLIVLAGLPMAVVAAAYKAIYTPSSLAIALDRLVAFDVAQLQSGDWLSAAIACCILWHNSMLLAAICRRWAFAPNLEARLSEVQRSCVRLMLRRSEDNYNLVSDSFHDLIQAAYQVFDSSSEPGYNLFCEKLCLRSATK